MENDRNKIDEEEADNCPIDVNYILDADLKNSYCETNANHQKHIDYLWHVHFASL